MSRELTVKTGKTNIVQSHYYDHVIFYLFFFNKTLLGTYVK